MEVTIKTTGRGKKTVAALAERFNAKFLDSGRGVCHVSVEETRSKAFLWDLEEMAGVVEYHVA